MTHYKSVAEGLVYKKSDGSPVSEAQILCRVWKGSKEFLNGDLDDSSRFTPVNKESDPNYMDQHAPGAKLDSGKIQVGLMESAFSSALMAVAEVATLGAEKYSDNGWLSVPNGGARYLSAAGRHRLARLSGEARDKETQCLHLAHEAWNVLAQLELRLRDIKEAK